MKLKIIQLKKTKTNNVSQPKWTRQTHDMDHETKIISLKTIWKNINLKK